MRRTLTAALALVVLSAGAWLHGQTTPQTQSKPPVLTPAQVPGPAPAKPPAGDIKDGRVAISGENPVINLSMTGGAPNSTSVSFWRVVYSPVGMGHVCYLTADLTGDGPSKDDIRMAFTDNDDLFGYIDTAIMPALDSTYRKDPVHSWRATFARSGDTRTAWKETIRAEQYTIDLIWKDFKEPFLLDTPLGGTRNPFGITSMFLPARAADVIINGTRVAGQPYARMRGTTQSSSAFLAFSETWVH
jgi:hypothetical protein